MVTVGSPEFFDLVEGERGRKRLTYVVKKGDDLKRIGKKFNLTVADLERINRFGAAHTELVVGQKLTVYVPMSAGREGQGGLRAHAGRRRPDAAGEPTLAPDAGTSRSAVATPRRRRGADRPRQRRRADRDPPSAPDGRPPPIAQPDING